MPTRFDYFIEKIILYVYDVYMEHMEGSLKDFILTCLSTNHE